MTLKFIELKTPESLQVIRDIAASIWPETFREILSSEQITYMMEMMYAPAAASSFKATVSCVLNLR